MREEKKRTDLSGIGYLTQFQEEFVLHLQKERPLSVGTKKKRILWLISIRF